MSDVKTRIESVQAGIDRLRDQIPAIEWQQATLLKLLAEMAAIVKEVAGGEVAKTDKQGKPLVPDRSAVLAKLSWQACRAIPPGLDGEARDAEICRILRSWNVSTSDLLQLGYGQVTRQSL